MSLLSTSIVAHVGSLPCGDAGPRSAHIFADGPLRYGHDLHGAHVRPEYSVVVHLTVAKTNSGYRRYIIMFVFLHGLLLTTGATVGESL